MKLQEVIKAINEKDYLFQISIPGNSFMQGKTSKLQALANSSSLEEYFDRIIKANNASSIFVRLFSRNGSAFKNRGEHLIFLNQPNTVATNSQNATVAVAQNTNNATEAIAHKYANQMNGIDQPPVKSNSAMMDIKEKIDYEALKIKHEMLQGIKTSLESECKELRKKVDTLQEEKLQLVKENSVSSERNKLEMEKAIFEAQKTQKEGLSGLVGELNENPETLKMIVGLLKPDHPMFKENEGDQMSGTKQIEAPRFHDNEEVNAILTDLPNTIKGLDPKVIARIYYIFLNGFAKDPGTVSTVFKMLFPNIPQE